MRIFNCIGLAALVSLAAAAPVWAYHNNESGSVYGPRNGTGTNFYDRQPNSGSDPWHQPRKPRIENQWDQAPGTNTWEQPKKPDLYPWGKPKY